MFLLRQHWKYDLIETDEGLWIVEKGQMGQSNDVIVLDELELNETNELPTKPWTFMIDGMEHLYT